MRPRHLVFVLVLIATSCGRVAGSETIPEGVSIAAGEHISCAIVADGGVACWGDRADVGAGFVRGDAALGISPPVAVSLPPGVEFQQVAISPYAAGFAHACALVRDGTAWCWGSNSYGELGDGGASSGEVPVAVQMPEGVSFSQMSMGRSHACALDAAGKVWCWGSGDHGQLGDNQDWYDDPSSTGLSWVPTQVSFAPDLSFSAVATGGEHTCALTTGATVWCWGDDVSLEPPLHPVEIPGPPDVTLSDLVAGDEHTCALTADGAAWCWYFPWGRDERNAFETNEPARVPLPNGVALTRIASGSSRICAISEETQVWCWSSWKDERTPIPIGGGLASGAIDVAVGNRHACAIATDSTVWCWGENEHGQLGDGTRETRGEPVRVTLDLSAPAPKPVSSAPIELDPVELEPFVGDAFLSPPPVWSLDLGETQRIYEALDGYLSWESPEYWGLPDRCVGSENDGGGTSTECIYAYFARLGVSPEALSLYREYDISVSRVAGSAPVWVTESYDWTTYGTNYDGATPNLIFTPSGIIDLSSSVARAIRVDLSAAFAAAFASDVDEQIEVAAREGFGSPDDVLLGAYSENFEVPLDAPRRTASGWAIPFSVQSGGGIHCCSWPFWARFELDLNEDAETTGVRFLDWCYVERVTFGSGEIPASWPKAIRDLGATMPACEGS